MTKYAGTFVLILILLTGCVDRSPLQPLMSVSPGEGIDASDWDEYGAV
ncbi:hypothetical protein [Desulfosediminicola flagellatus]|nr:hypothetical protein [Desulfosediminicola flagellatus]